MHKSMTSETTPDFEEWCAALGFPAQGTIMKSHANTAKDDEVKTMNRREVIETLSQAAKTGLIPETIVVQEEIRPGSTSNTLVKSLARQLGGLPAQERQTRLDILTEAARQRIITPDAVILEEQHPGQISTDMIKSLAKEIKGEHPFLPVRDPLVARL